VSTSTLRPDAALQLESLTVGHYLAVHSRHELYGRRCRAAKAFYSTVVLLFLYRFRFWGTFPPKIAYITLLPATLPGA
jgi:hypothetical protein